MSQGSLEQRVNTTGLDHSKALYSATFFNLILSDQKRKVVKLLSKLNHIKEEPEIKFANICWVIEKAREFQKSIYSFIDYTKAFDCVDHNKLENSSRDGNIRPPYLPPEKPVCRSRSNH